MTNKILTIHIFPYLFLLSNCINAQSNKSIDFYNQIKKFDLVTLWHDDTIRKENKGDNFLFPEPLGYIGTNFQRFYIHYSKVVKDKTNPYVYQVYGKTRVKDNICSFKGTITIIKANILKKKDTPKFTQGSVLCNVNFEEDNTQKSSGSIIGILKTEFYLDKKNRIHYDDLMLVADGYSNNQCVAKWNSYTNAKSKKCNWGDFRIPESKELDSGAGDVSINEKYREFGWQSYIDAYSADRNKAKIALKVERYKWWE